MSDLSSQRSKTWNVYTASNPGPSHSQTGRGGVDEEGPWKSFGTSMSAISFGFVATAILISMFLIMAIFEHLFKPTQQFSASTPESMLPSYQEQHSLPTTKQGNAQSVQSPSYACDLSVLMPGQQYPTYLAQPAPLPCRREEAHWPSHQQHHFVFN
ncbi:unnamed protein product [Trifolium pratense]|uniref:Uncharacterized protein n=1 Tax=Trifolium pratense TaxID=57577 RepID=A0ACB0JWK3_TRIPR|nr:unnamed protein product [Trifolium pratense]